ncbi:hypothetical protein C8035_v011205 [Colletotrichum spinosum]|uniref:Uncharacterized protein n=1 Tax=Colletotrichum spinosum TaxID=1347390 RepID=A0A4R8Q5D1_9PEZI|nr:hypothetical protein C8035_v011205 [Colletotrichum spinosum]
MAAHCQLEGPLVGPLRESRRSELARNHPAWPPARQVQAGIMTTQQAIRRTPGVPARIANELCEGLQKYAQDVNELLRQAINEVADYRIDLDYNEKVLCSSKLETNIIHEEREQLKRDITDLNRKFDNLENRLACYHVDVDNHKNKVREILAKLDQHQDGDEPWRDIVKELLKVLKEHMDRPSSIWLHGESDQGSTSKVVTNLSAASIAALEEQEPRSPKFNQKTQQQLILTRPLFAMEHREAVPSTDNAIRPFKHQQNADYSFSSAPTNASYHNGFPSGHPGAFSISHGPEGSRALPSVGYNQTSSIAPRTQQHMPPSRPFSRADNGRSSFTGGFKQPGVFDGPGGYGSQHEMPMRPGTSMGQRNYGNPQSTFRPNAPEFHPGMTGGTGGGGCDTNGAAYNYGYGPGANLGPRREIHASGGQLTSPTQHPATRNGFGDFESHSTNYARQSPLIPQNSTFGPNQHYGSNSAGYGPGMHSQQRNFAVQSSGQGYQPHVNPRGHPAVPFGHGGSAHSSMSRSGSANGLTSGVGFSSGDDGDNDRYTAAFEGVWGLARG